MTDENDLIRRGDVIAILSAASRTAQRTIDAIAALPAAKSDYEARVLDAPHVNETPKSGHDSADVLTTLPAAVTLADALKVPEVRAMVEAARKTILAAEMREAYHHLPNDRNRIGDPKSRKSKARDSWLKAFRRAALSAEIALRAIKEGEE